MYNIKSSTTTTRLFAVWLWFITSLGGTGGLSLRLTSSSFHGRVLETNSNAKAVSPFQQRAQLFMRKQKASDKRTRRRQRGGDDDDLLLSSSSSTASLTTSPMTAQGQWKQKTATRSALQSKQAVVTGGRGRSRKRSMLYTSLSFYHNKFLQLLQDEYKAEVSIMISEAVCIIRSWEPRSLFTQ